MLPPSLAGCSLLPPADAGIGASHPLVSSADSCLSGSRAIGCSGLGLEQGWSSGGGQLPPQRLQGLLGGRSAFFGGYSDGLFSTYSGFAAFSLV